MTKQQLIETIRRVIKHELNEATNEPKDDFEIKYRIVSIDNRGRILDYNYYDTMDDAREAARKLQQDAKIVKIKKPKKISENAPAKEKEKPGPAVAPKKSPTDKPKKRRSLEPENPETLPDTPPKAQTKKATMTEAEILSKIIKRFKAKKNG